MPRKPRKGHRMVWLDLEMTGLDPETCVILEVATIVTDSELEVLGEGPDLVIHATEAELARMVPVVREMHEKSGLTDRVRESRITVEEAEARTLAFVKEHCSRPATYPLCGNSIGVDRRFLARYMPRLDAHLSYRSIDVSSIKELARRWYPKLWEKRPRKKKGHRALADIRESIEELRYWRRSVFAPTGD